MTITATHKLATQSWTADVEAVETTARVGGPACRRDSSTIAFSVSSHRARLCGTFDIWSLPRRFDVRTTPTSALRSVRPRPDRVGCNRDSIIGQPVLVQPGAFVAGQRHSSSIAPLCKSGSGIAVRLLPIEAFVVCSLSFAMIT